MRINPFHSDNVFSNFTKQYSLSKTLRFELKPDNKTKTRLKEFIKSDTQRDKDYQELKKIVDEYHKIYIEKSLSSTNILKKEDLEKMAELLSKSKKLKLYKEKEKNKKELDEFQKQLRSQIANCFVDKKELFGKELITKLLPEWLDQNSIEDAEHKKNIVKNFSQFTTYLTGFHKNRENMYSKDQSTAISYRIINENLPRFSSNINTYEKILKNFPGLQRELENLKSDLKEEFAYFKINSIKNLFEINFFNKCLTQKGIDNYNFIVGGKTLESGKKTQGINEKINLYRQKQKEVTKPNKNNDKEEVVKIKFSNKKLPFMEILYKQILSDGQSHSFYDPKEFKDRKEVLKSIHEFWEVIFKTRDDKGLNVLKKIESLFINLSAHNNELDKIYFKVSELSKFSNTLFKDYSVVQSALEYYSEKETSTKKEKEEWLKKDFFNFEEIHKALSSYSKEENDDIEVPEENILLFYFKSKLQDKIDTNNKKEKPLNLLSHIESLYKSIHNISASSDYEFNKGEIQTIQSFLQSLMDLLHLIKPVYLEKDKKKIEDLDKDTTFYSEFESLYEKLLPVVKLYDKSRNYIAKNKNHLEKIKINFEDSTLLDGWDINKETDNLSVILRKKENDQWLYYLGVMDRKNKKLFDYQLNFDDHKTEKSIQKKNELKEKLLAGEDQKKYYEKMNYKLLPDPSKMLPRVFFSKKHLSYFNPSKEILNIRDQKTYAKNNGEDFKLKDCHKLIDFYKESIDKHYDWKKFNFQFSKTNQYKDISDFYAEVSSQSYKLSFDKIKADYIEEKVKEGELYLFQIYNKDFSEYSKGKPNLHTSYFKLLFEKENLEYTVFKLNGQAEVFYRKASKERKTTHQSNRAIQNKNKHNLKKESVFKYDLIKDKRFTEDKFFFHFPITLNFKARGLNSYNFNQSVLQCLKDNKNINIIGIDRGERHLAYYTVINQDREILDQGSFNNITTSYKNKDKQTVDVKTKYHELLEKREKERDKSRKSWTEIENIKELKSGYLSHLVHKISQLMIEHNAIVVFEDLNSGFKRGRMKFEKQVYQKLEKALIDKLNYLVFKDNKPKDAGGALNAYQLTAPFEGFKKMGKQTGFVFYTPAYYTSKVDPLTGFVNLIYPKYENIKKSQNFFKSFENIYFDNKENYFVFEYQDGKVNPKRKSESEALWKVCTHGQDRYKYDRSTKSNKKVNVTEEMIALFDKHNINYKEGKNLIEEMVKQDKKDFFIKLTQFLNLTIQLRHISPKAKTSDEQDFILSPVAYETGCFFDSRKAKENEPKNADANGAYHIALKGLKTIKDINEEKEKFKIKSVKNKDWFQFIRSKSISPKKKKAS